MKNIAVSKANFEELIKNNFIYVDKTKYLHSIVDSNEIYYFLSRPRRFGKSLFVSTLESFFKGKKELFKGLYVYNTEWEWEEYPVITLDFNKLPSENREMLEKGMRDNLLKFAEEYEIDDLQVEKTFFMFPKLVESISKKYNKGVVLLIDEYDKPIISNLGKNIDKKDNFRLRVAKSNQEFLKIFYDNLKSLEPYLRLVFITGVSKFSKISIFSTLNNLIEIDKEAEFAEIMGYTEKELYKYFAAHLKKLAEKYELTVKEAKQIFRKTYNGFRFTEKDVKVYNPFSSGRALNFSSLDNYWFESGTPTFLVNLIKERKFDLTELDNLVIGRDEIKAYDIEKLQLVPLLFQTGYLTIKNIEDQIIYTLGYPNYEVENSFSLNLIKSFSEEKIRTPIIHRIKRTLIEKDFDKFIDYMKSLFANIANINIPTELKEREHYYHSIFYLTGILLADNYLGVYSEVLTSEGRIDMLVETEDNIYVIEFKCNQSAEQAVNQIKEKNYSERFKIKEKGIVLIGINFNTDKRNITEFEIEGYE